MKKPLLIVGVVIVIGLLLVGSLLVFALLRGSGPSRNSVSIEKEVETPPELTLRSFRQLRGTKYFSAEIVTEGGSSYSSYSSSRWFEFGDGSGGLIRNLVFLDSETLLSQTLFENNHSFIINMVSFPPQPSKSVPPGEEPEIVPIRWFVYEVAHHDTNQDGELNRGDTRVIGVSDVDGTRYKELLTGINDIHTLTWLESGDLLVIYRQNEDRFAATIDLDAQEIIATQPLPDLGIEVK